jgi:hypothetical protein
MSDIGIFFITLAELRYGISESHQSLINKESENCGLCV